MFLDSIAVNFVGRVFLVTSKVRQELNTLDYLTPAGRRELGFSVSPTK